MKLSATIKSLNKNTLSTLTTHDMQTHEFHTLKRESKRNKLILALKNTTALKTLKAVEYTKPRETQPIISLAELLIALTDNTSLELMDISHNQLDEAAVKALEQLLQQQKVPLKQLYIDYINHSAQINLSRMIDSLENHTTMQVLSLQNNELSSETCQSLLHVITCQTNSLRSIHLTHCTIAKEDLARLQKAAAARGKEFRLSIEHMDSSEHSRYKNTDTNYSQLMLVRALNLPKAPIRLSKSDGNTPPKHYYGPFFAKHSSSSEEMPLESSIPKSQSESDIQNYKETIFKLNVD